MCWSQNDPFESFRRILQTFKFKEQFRFTYRYVFVVGQSTMNARKWPSCIIDMHDACPPHISFVSSFGISTLPSLVAQFIIFSQAFSRWRALPGPSLPSQMEHKRDADAAGLTWPRSNTRTTQSTSLSSDAYSSAVPLNPPPQGNPMAPTTLGSSSTGDNSLTNSGMYSTGTHPPTPFPTSENRHPPPPHQGRFSERLVHQIHFKIFTHSNNT